MFLPTKERDPDLYPYRQGLVFAFFNAINWQIATATPTVLFMAYLGADSFQTGLVMKKQNLTLNRTKIRTKL